MSRPSRKERRRIERRDRHRDMARLQHDFPHWEFHGSPSRGALAELMEEEFLSAVRGLDSRTAALIGRDLVRVRPGRADLWNAYLSALQMSGAPGKEILAAAKRWAATGDRPEAHSAYIVELVRQGFPERAAAHAEEVLARSSRKRDHPGLWELEHVAGLAAQAAKKARKATPRPAPKRRKPPRRGTAARSPRPAPPERCVASLPLPPSSPEATAVTFHIAPLDLLIARLRADPEVDLDSIELAMRGAEVLAEDHYDRLLSLALVRGVERLDHQIETVFRVLKRFRGRVLLADEVGLGKTIEAGLILKEYLLRGQVRRALVLCPPALVSQWRGELEEKFDIPVITTQDRSFRRDPDGFWKEGSVLVASLAAARQSPHRERLLAERFDLVIADEAHHLKNRSTQGWRLVNELRSRFFLMLTATPVETNLNELYNLVTLLRPGTLGTEGEFRRRFLIAGDPGSPKDPEKLRELLRQVMIRNTRAVCGVALPPRSVCTEIVRPTREEEILYRRMVDASRTLAARHWSRIRTLLEQAGSSPLAVERSAEAALRRCDEQELRRFLGDSLEGARAISGTRKIDRLAELIPGGKVLVFSRFLASLDWIARELRRRGIPFALFDGRLSGADKDRSVAAFAAPGTDVLLCSEIGGEGRNLQFAHRLINFDLPWNPMKIEQRIGRLHRIGQTEAVEVVNLATAGSAEERILDVLDHRVNLFELVVGEMDLLLGELADERDFGDVIFDIYAQSQREKDIDTGFDALAEQLLVARGKLERTKALDEALFGEDYDV